MSEMLSVVIITCNRKEEILKAIESCRTHTQRAFELVVIDNNSSDNTKEAVSLYCDKHKISLKYIYLDRNTGVSFARNIGYRIASGDILFFIDDDAIVISEGQSLDVVADYMRKNEDVFACGGISLDYRYGGQLSFVKNKNDMKNDYYQIRSYVGFNHFIKKGFTEREFIYPDNLFYGSEELYVGFTILKYGGRIVNVNEHVVQHNPSVNTRIDRREGLMNGYINTYVIKKYFLKGHYRMISSGLFYIRIARFCKFNLHTIWEYRKLAKVRYDSKYENQMNDKQISQAVKAFGLKAIL